MEITWKSADGFVQLPGQRFTPRRFVATGRARELPDVEIALSIDVDKQGRARCRRIELESASDNVWLTGQSLRDLKVAELTREAKAAAAAMWRFQGTTAGGTSTFVAADSDEQQEIYREQVGDLRRPRRGVPYTDEQLEKITRVYRAAVKDGRPPAQTIAEGLSPPISRATASRWIRAARDRGEETGDLERFLGPAKRGKATG